MYPKVALINTILLTMAHRNTCNVLFVENSECYNQTLQFFSALGMGDTTKCGIDLIPSKYMASIVDTNTFLL